MNIDMLRDAKPNDIIWDKDSKASVKGLHLRVSPKGVKTFLFYYRSKDGDQRRPKIGEFGDMTLAEARVIAKKLRDRVSAGEDPKAEWDSSRRELTVRGLFQKTFDNHWAEERFVNSGWASNAKHYFDKHIDGPLGSLKLSDVTATKVRAWHSSMKKIPYAANRSLGVLSKMFSYAEEIEIRKQGTNPCFLINKFTERKRKRVGTPEELRALFLKFDEYQESHPRQVAFLRVLMLSGSRPSALLRATWDQLHVVGGKGVLVFDGKTTHDSGEQEVLTLPSHALAVIMGLEKTGDKIFGITMPKKFWNKIRQEAGIEGLWARDFRRTFASIGLSSGVNIGTIGELLNHKSTQTTKRYAMLSGPAREQAAEGTASEVMRIGTRDVTPRSDAQ